MLPVGVCKGLCAYSECACFGGGGLGEPLDLTPYKLDFPFLGIFKFGVVNNGSSSYFPLTFELIWNACVIILCGAQSKASMCIVIAIVWIIVLLYFYSRIALTYTKEIGVPLYLTFPHSWDHRLLQLPPPQP